MRRILSGLVASMSLVSVMGAMVLGLMLAPAVAAACSGATEQARAEGRYAASLPDCRVYEQVSPVSKNGADAVGTADETASSPEGERVTYFSLLPFPGIGSAANAEYVDTRGSTAWSIQALLPTYAPAVQATVLGSDEDLSETLLTLTRGNEALAPGASPTTANTYIRDNEDGQYRLLEPEAESVRFETATPDGAQILFRDSAPNVVPGVPNEGGEPYLYEWEAGHVTFVGYLPESEGGGVPPHGTFAGAGEIRGNNTYAQNAISTNGSHIFFTVQEEIETGPGEEHLENGRIFVREPALDRTVAVSPGQAVWLGATPNGEQTFYSEGGELYRFDVASETRESISHPTTGTGEVLGAAGISEDGSYAYFVAKAALAPGATAGETNLYVWHAGAATNPTFVAELGPGESDEADWRNFVEGGEPDGPADGGKSSRVSGTGEGLIFTTRQQVTGYENANEVVELYYYNAAEPRSAANPTCVSCEPGGEQATSSTYLTTGSETLVRPHSGTPIMPRNLSAEGGRIFFETAEKLVPQDTNGAMDAYEWEKAGVGSCTSGASQFYASAHGCLYLVSTGQSSAPSYFGDASRNGSDVFVFTRQQLVTQDEDNNADLYDARVEGGIPGQNPPPPPGPCAGSGCLAGLAPVPLAEANASATASGNGNAPPPPPPAKPVVVKPLTRAQKLTKALKACKRDRTKKKRAQCEKQARVKYGSKASTKAKKARRGTR